MLLICETHCPPISEITSGLFHAPIAPSLRLAYVDALTFSEQLIQAGIPEFIAFLVTGFATDTKSKQFETVSKDLENLLGRKPTTLEAGLKEVWKSKKKR